ncbi:MAG TPA: hypothetical protein VFZ53_14320 [Polyangiaceae bacterium]
MTLSNRRMAALGFGHTASAPRQRDGARRDAFKAEMRSKKSVGTFAEEAIFHARFSEIYACGNNEPTHD